MIKKPSFTHLQGVFHDIWASFQSVNDQKSSLFRWFKFTLKPPYSIAHDKLRLAIWTLPFGLFGSNLDTKDLETYPRTYSGHFWNMSIFDDSRAIWVLFQKMGGLRKSKFSRWRSDCYPLIDLVLRGEVPRLNHGPICFPSKHLRGCYGRRKLSTTFWHFHKGLKHT